MGLFLLTAPIISTTTREEFLVLQRVYVVGSCGSATCKLELLRVFHGNTVKYLVKFQRIINMTGNSQ